MFLHRRKTTWQYLRTVPRGVTLNKKENGNENFNQMNNHADVDQ
jgi:hypothetical protein